MKDFVRVVAMISALGAMWLALGDVVAYTDAQIKERYAFADRCEHVEDSRNHVRRAWTMAEDDTNRYARVLRELAVEDTNRTERVIRSLRFYRTPRSLPFLYAYSTNALYGADALRAIFAIEGVTSNSVAAAEVFFSQTNIASRLVQTRDDACIKMVNLAGTTDVEPDVRERAMLVARNFAANLNECHQWLDEALIESDPSYRYSKRRLWVFRGASARGVNQYSSSYVTNAINELVAYPEANLPD